MSIHLRYRDDFICAFMSNQCAAIYEIFALPLLVLRAVYDQRYKCHNLRDGGRRPPATMFTSPRLLQRQQQAYRLRIAISAYPTCIRR